MLYYVVVDGPWSIVVHTYFRLFILLFKFYCYILHVNWLCVPPSWEHADVPPSSVPPSWEHADVPPSLKCTPLLRLYPLPWSRSAIGYIKPPKDGTLLLCYCGASGTINKSQYILRFVVSLFVRLLSLCAFLFYRSGPAIAMCGMSDVACRVWVVPRRREE